MITVTLVWEKSTPRKSVYSGDMTGLVQTQYMDTLGLQQGFSGKVPKKLKITIEDADS